MKKIFLTVACLYSLATMSVITAKINLFELNRELLSAISETLHKISNLNSSVVAICAHNYFVNKKTTGIFDVRDSHLFACLAGGWIGDALNNALDKQGLPDYVKAPLNHTFALGWLTYNIFVNKNAWDLKNLAVGGYIALNWIDRYRYGRLTVDVDIKGSEMKSKIGFKK